MEPQLTKSVHWILKLSLMLALLACLVAISQSSIAAENDLVKTALAIDLLLTVPIVYFLLIRKTSVPRITIAPVFFICFLLGSAFLPNGLSVMSLVGTIVVPAVELALLVYLGFRIFRTRQAYVNEKHSGFDLMENLRKAFERELNPPAIARAAAFEVAVFGYLLFVWKRPQGLTFAYHRRNSPQLLLAIFLFLLLVETIGIHLLLGLWSDIVAWIATVLSIYLGLQLVAHLKALSLRPIIVTQKHLLIRCGILGDTAIPFATITHVSTIGGEGPDGLDLLPLGGMSQPNVQIELSEPAAVYGVYGTNQKTNLIRLSVDDPAAFVAAVSERS